MVLSRTSKAANINNSLVSDTTFSTWQSELAMTRAFWEMRHHKDPAGLLRGTPLAIAEQWLQQHPNEIAEQDRQFIQASLQAAQAAAAEQRSHWEDYIYLACAHVKERFAAGEELAALRDAVQLGQKLYEPGESNTPLNQMRVIVMLQEMLANIRELCHLEHDHDLTQMALSPDGKLLAAISKDAVIRLWRVSDGAELPTLTNNQEKINTLAFSPDNRLLAYTSEDSTLRLWHLGHGSEYSLYKVHRPDLNCLTFSPNSKVLAISTSMDNRIQLWREDKQELTQVDNNKAIQNLCFSPNSQLLATRTYDDLIKLWNPKDGRKLTTLDGGAAAYAMAFSLDSQLIATTGADHTIVLWQVGLSLLSFNMIKLATLKGHLADITELVFSPDRQLLASKSRDSTVKLWTLPEGVLKGTLVGLEDAYSSLQFAPNARKLYAISRYSPLQWWDLERLDQKTKLSPCLSSYSLLPQKKGHWQIHFNQESEIQFLAQQREKHIELWSSTKRPFRTLGDEQDRPTSLAISPDGQYVALGDSNKIVHIRNREGAKLLTLEGHGREVRYVCFADNDTLASASTDNTINIWKLGSGTQLIKIQGHDGAINRIAFSPDGSTLASASEDGTVKLWHIHFSMLAYKEIELASLQVYDQGVSCLGFSGKTLVTGDYAGQLQFWDWEAGALQHVLQAHDEGITHLAISPDGTQLVTSSYDHTIKRWSIEGQALATIRAHRDRVDTVAWHPEGHVLASASEDGTTKLLTLDGGEIATLHTCHCPKVISIYVENSDGVYPPQQSSQRSTRQQYRSHLTTLAFTSDGKTLVDGFSCGKTRCWNLDLAHLLSQGKAWLERRGVEE